MATDLSGQSTTPASNTTVGGVSIAEGTAPSNINDGMRATIAQAKGALLAVTAAGTNTITATYAPVPDAYVSGWLYIFKAANTNTGATTFNANSLGAKDVKKIAGTATAALTGGEIVAGAFNVLQYDGTDMLLLQIPRATETLMEAATSDGPAVTPLSVKWHPGVAKAWAVLDSSSTALASHGVSSITDTGTGDQTVNFSTNFSSVNFCAVATPGSSAASFVRTGNKAVGSCQFTTRNAADSLNADAHPLHVIFFGSI